MSDVASNSLLIVLGVLVLCALIASVWVEVDEARRDKLQWRKEWREWMRIIK